MSEKKKSIGALWENVSKTTGKEYLSGHIEINGEKIPLIVFKNSYKKADKQPDYQMYLKEDKPRENAPQQATEQASQVDDVINTDDIPF